MSGGRLFDFEGCCEEHSLNIPYRLRCSSAVLLDGTRVIRRSKLLRKRKVMHITHLQLVSVSVWTFG